MVRRCEAAGSGRVRKQEPRGGEGEEDGLRDCAAHHPAPAALPLIPFPHMASRFSQEQSKTNVVVKLQGLYATHYYISESPRFLRNDVGNKGDAISGKKKRKGGYLGNTSSLMVLYDNTGGRSYLRICSHNLFAHIVCLHKHKARPICAQHGGGEAACLLLWPSSPDAFCWAPTQMAI